MLLSCLLYTSPSPRDKNKGFIEQAINEYQKFTLSEKNAAETFINDL